MARAHVIPIGVNLTSIAVSSAWWIETSQLLEGHGFQGVWSWDHFVSRGRRDDSVLECWSTLAAVAARTTRIRLGSFVTNVMNRHPALLARIAATVQEQSGGRVELGIGIGGNAREHDAYGMAFPPPDERADRLEEAISVLRLLWSGGPVDFGGRYYALREAYAAPAPAPPPRVVVGAQSRRGAVIAARLGDAWTVPAEDLERLLPHFVRALDEGGRTRREVPVVLELPVRGASSGGVAAGAAFLAQPEGEVARWMDRGADELVLSYVRPGEIAALAQLAERLRLRS